MSNTISATGIYKRQNQTIHKAFVALSMPYQEEKNTWVTLFRSMLGRENINGLTDLTLGERSNVIAYLIGQGAKVENSFLPGDTAEWSHRKIIAALMYNAKRHGRYTGR